MRYELRLSVNIREVDPAGHYMGGASQLNVGEEIQFEAADFLEMAAQLGEFHRVAERIKHPPAGAEATCAEPDREGPFAVRIVHEVGYQQAHLTSWYCEHRASSRGPCAHGCHLPLI